MSSGSGILRLPTAEQLICQIEKLVKTQSLAGKDVPILYSKRTDDGIFRGEFVIPDFGEFSIMRSMYNLEYVVLDCRISTDLKNEWQSGDMKNFAISRFSKESPWVLHGTNNDISPSIVERLSSFVNEPPREVFERLFDLWFYDYSGIVPDVFTLEKIESIFCQSYL
jgi:hypothetical protein